MRAGRPGEALSVGLDFPHPPALRAATFSPEGRRKIAPKLRPRPQAHPAGVVANEGQRSAARRGLVSASVSYGSGADGLSHHPHTPWRSASDDFENSGPRFCRAGLSRRGLASSSRRDRSVPRSVPEASRERGATLARRRRTHPAKRHASGRPPLGDGMRAIIREAGRAGISLPFVRAGAESDIPLFSASGVLSWASGSRYFPPLTPSDYRTVRGQRKAKEKGISFRRANQPPETRCMSVDIASFFQPMMEMG